MNIKPNSDLSMRHLLVVVLLSAFLATAIAALFYWIYFGFRPSNISYDLAKWGATGDFFGGILNPIFGLLGLVALLLTLMQTERALRQNEEMLQLTQRQLTLSADELKRSADAAERHVIHLEKESGKEEVRRVIETISSEMDFQLSATLFDDDLLVPLNLPQNTSVDTFLEKLTNHLLAEGRKDTIYQFASTKMNREFRDITAKLLNLLDFITQYLSLTNGTKSPLTEHYILKYSDVCTRLFLNNFIDNESLALFSRDEKNFAQLRSIRKGWE